MIMVSCTDGDQIQVETTTDGLVRIRLVEAADWPHIADLQPYQALWLVKALLECVGELDES